MPERISVGGMAFRRTERGGGLKGASAKSRLGCRSPAIQTSFPRRGGTVQQGPAQRQRAQIVQPCMTLDDSLP